MKQIDLEKKILEQMLKELSLTLEAYLHENSPIQKEIKREGFKNNTLYWINKFISQDRQSLVGEIKQKEYCQNGAWHDGKCCCTCKYVKAEERHVRIDSVLTIIEGGDI